MMCKILYCNNFFPDHYELPLSFSRQVMFRKGLWMKIPTIVVFIALCVSGCANNSAIDQFSSNSLPPETAVPLTISRNPAVHAQVYMSPAKGGEAIVQVQGRPPQRLAGIDLGLYSAYQSAFFRLLDQDHDGVSELAVLQSVDFSGIKKCYDVFRYHFRSARFERVAARYFCTNDR